LNLAHLGFIITGITICIGFTSLSPAFTRKPAQDNDGGDPFLKYIPSISWTKKVIDDTIKQDGWQKSLTESLGHVLRIDDNQGSPGVTSLNNTYAINPSQENNNK
jgi:hypothetical protein